MLVLASRTAVLKVRPAELVNLARETLLFM